MRVGIVGLGLMGGSLGMALRKLGRSIEVVGVAPTEEGVAAARRRGAVDQASSEPSILDGSDVVVIATPIDEVGGVIDRIGSLVLSGTVITDVASVKRPVRQWVRRMPEPGLFLGGHPVAGKSQSGIEHSDPSIFKNEPWIFTPLEMQSLRPFDTWLDLVAAIGARPAFLSPEEHDRQMAYLSHLGFTLSAALAQTVKKQADPIFAGPGYRGMVRLASGDTALYESIARENCEPLVAAIDEFAISLKQFRDRIQAASGVRELFQEAADVAV